MALSIDLEDWFHSYNYRGVVGLQDWDLLESRVEPTTIDILQILAARGITATFFVLGWVAEKYPHIVKAVAAEGHEIASHGYNHEPVYSLSPEEFRTDVRRSKHYLEDLAGRAVVGYRAPCFSITDWALALLEEEGFEYDSSVVPALGHDRYGKVESMDSRVPIALIGEKLVEVSLPCLRLGKRGVPWGGGGYFRLMPYDLWTKGVRHIRNDGLPYVFYTHPWELDAAQPLAAGIGGFNRVRQRINLKTCREKFCRLVDEFDWGPLGEVVAAWHSARRSGEQMQGTSG